MAITRCETGITELDQILRGGIPEGNVVLLAGGSGMGKTTLTLEFLSHGAEKGERGLFLSVTEPVKVLERNALEYQFVKPEYLKDGIIRLVDLRAVLQRMGLAGPNQTSLDNGAALVDAIEAIVKEYRIKRLVVDSLTAICQRLDEPSKIRDFVFRFGLVLGNAG